MPKPMTAGEERRFVLSELKEIKKLAQASDRALTGTNGDTGLKADMKEVKSKVEGFDITCHQYNKNFEALTILLRGNVEDKEDAGLVGEHIETRKYIFEDLKPQITKIKFWLFTLVVGFIIVEILTSAR